MQSVPFYVAEGVPLNQAVGFVANCVIVDNLTSSWLYVPGGARFVPPYQYGAIVPLKQGDAANITWPVPTGIVAGPVGKGTAICTFTDADLPTSIGQPSYTNIPPVPIAVGSTPITAVLPTGCQALLITSQTALTTVTVKGVTSAQFYAPAGTVLPVIVPIDPVLDPSVTVTPFLGTVEVVALFYGAQEPIQNVSATVVAPVITPAAASSYLPVLQRPTFDTLCANFALAAGTGQTLIAAPGLGFSLVLRAVFVTFNAVPVASTAILLGNASGDQSYFRVAQILPAAATPEKDAFWDWDDYAIPTNTPVIITGTAAASVAVTITYSVVTTANWPTG